MKARDVIGKKVVAVRQERCDAGNGTRAQKRALAIELEHGVVVMGVGRKCALVFAGMLAAVAIASDEKEFPTVRGLGFIRNTGFAFVAIDGKTVKAEVGSSIGEFVVLEVRRDSVVFRRSDGRESAAYIGDGSVVDGPTSEPLATDFEAQNEFRALMGKVMPRRPDVAELLIELGLRREHFIVSQDSPAGAAILLRGPVRVYLGNGPCIVERVTGNTIQVIQLFSSGERRCETAAKQGDAFDGLPVPTFLR